MIEVELKFAITYDARSRLEASLGTIGDAYRLHNSDVYYDTPSFDLFSQAVFVRIRNRQRLEFKFNEQAAPEHLFCTERVFPLSARRKQLAEMNRLFAGFLPQWQTASTIGEALQKNDLIELARIENSRAEYRYENLVVCVDHVWGLGDFLEIETQCEVESETPGALEQVRAFAAGLEARQVHIGYVELWLQKYLPRAYRQGKYQEELFSLTYA